MHDNDKPCESAEHTAWVEMAEAFKSRVMKEIKNPKLKLPELLGLVELLDLTMNFSVNASNYDGMTEAFKARLERRKNHFRGFN